MYRKSPDDVMRENAVQDGSILTGAVAVNTSCQMISKLKPLQIESEINIASTSIIA